MRRLSAIGLLVATALLAGCYDPAADGYEIVWQDDFDGTELSSTWETHVPSQPAPTGDEIVVSDGTMRLRAYDPDHWSAISTRGSRQDGEPNYPNMLDWQEGFFEARIRYNDSPYNHSGFWLFSSATAEAWPVQDAHCPTLVSEIDVMESLVATNAPQSQRVTHTIHENTNILGSTNDPLGTCDRVDQTSTALSSFGDSELRLDEWHDWAARWTSDEVCWYLDRVEVGCRPTFDSTAQPMHLLLSVGFYQCKDLTPWLYPDGCPPGPPDYVEIEVDWVRAWQMP